MAPRSPSSSGAAPTRRTGSQEPRVRICPDWDYTYADDAVTLANDYAFPLDEWEVLVLEDWLSRDEWGRPACITCGLDVPRQNGKNYCIEIFEMTVAVSLGWHVLHTAHEVKTSMKAFHRVLSYFDGPSASPEMRAMVANVRRANGQECITLTNGGIIEFSARSRNAARGFDDVQVVVLDEGQELQDEHMEALMSTLSASSTGTRQIIYTGTPTPPGSPATVMAQLRERALAGKVEHCCWHSWSVESCPAEDATWEDVVDLVYASNPAMGLRLDGDFTMQEFATLSIDGFARERLDWWEHAETLELLAGSDIDACTKGRDELPDRAGWKVVYGVKFALDGNTVALSAAAIDPRVPKADAVPHVELIATKPTRIGVAWIADFIEARKETTSAVVIDGLYGRDMLVDRLDKRISRKAIIEPSPTDVATAASMVKERVDTHTMTFFDKNDRLLKSARKAERRQIGNKGAWGFGGPDPTPIESGSLALWGVMTTRRNAGHKMRVR